MLVRVEGPVCQDPLKVSGMDRTLITRVLMVLQCLSGATSQPESIVPMVRLPDHQGFHLTHRPPDSFPKTPLQSGRESLKSQYTCVTKRQCLIGASPRYKKT